MAWFEEGIFYHIYPLGLTGAPKENSYGEPVKRLDTLYPWIDHIKSLGFNALYIGPLFESVGHGYETTDYRRLDSRLGTNEDLRAFVSACHEKGIKVVLDGVFNHVGRDFFAFKDLKQYRESSRYRDWFCNLNFYGNNEYGDGFSYANWGGYNLLVKLNLRNPEVKGYILDTVRYWVNEFDIDGLRLDAADVLDFDFMRDLRGLANGIKPDFWLMGEVIHGEYSRWVNEGTLHSVTNYHLHKALYSGHNDHNYFEIAHTVKRLNDMGAVRLYNFVDNHDVERINTKLVNKAHFKPVHILLYTLPGVPSVYYGSEFAIDGKKERFSDDSLRPCLKLENFSEDLPATRLIAALGRIRGTVKELSYGQYKELLLKNRQYAFSRTVGPRSVIVTVNNDDSDYVMTLPCSQVGEYMGALSGQKVSVVNGTICVNVKACDGEIWIPLCDGMNESDILADIPETVDSQPENIKTETETQEVPQAVEVKAEENVSAEKDETVPEAPSSDQLAEAFEKGRIAGLQEAVIALMEKRGNVSESMRNDALNNIWHDSLINWIKSF